LKPVLSIIIPCYNTEHTLEETLLSVIEQQFDQWEAIIVNDGSPDNLETIALEFVSKDDRFKYFKKENGGLATARNFGIEQANGKYILPLDSDNKIRPDYAKTAIDLMEGDNTIGVVYGDAQYFGDKTGIWKVGEFDFESLLLRNYIDACAVFRKSLWETTEGYDCLMPYQGNEDWDLWIKFRLNNAVFFYLEQITFDYRVTKDSMISRFNETMIKENRLYIRKKYAEIYFNKFEKYYLNYSKLENQPLKSSLFFF
jgi:glycosyltransferase involved in cell wall biosynthesis